MRDYPPKDPLVLSGTVASAPYATKIVRRYNWPLFRLFLIAVLEDGYFAEVTRGKHSLPERFVELFKSEPIVIQLTCTTYNVVLECSLYEKTGSGTASPSGALSIRWVVGAC